MKRIKFLLPMLLLLITVYSAKAQVTMGKKDGPVGIPAGPSRDTHKFDDDELIMKGKPQVRIFADYQHTNQFGGSANKFEITRAYFGYGFKFTKKWSTKITLDVGDPGNSALQMTAYLKQAYVQYEANGLRVRVGMENTLSFDEIESFWGHRYVMKTFQDEYGLNSSADIGITGKYSLNEYVSVDASIMNGSGYKNVQQDSTFRYGIGVSVTPVKGLKGRFYFDNFNKHGVVQQSIITFLGYKGSNWMIGGEYDIQNNSTLGGSKTLGARVNPAEDHNVTGISVFGDYSFGKIEGLGKMGVFARYDNLSSNKIDGSTIAWNEKMNGGDNSTYVIGLEVTPVKGISISPNYRYKKFVADNSSAASYFFANLLIDL